MKLTNSCLVLFMSAAVLSGCSQGDSNSADEESKILVSAEEVIKKHKATDLPVNIFKDSNELLEGQQVTFLRSITDVEFKEFDDSLEIEFFDYYDDVLRDQGFDLQSDYKLLVISMKHEVEGNFSRTPRAAFMLNAGSGLVIGDEDLASTNEFLRYQQQHIATDYSVGKNFKESGVVLLAVPNELANDKNLQLKVVQKLDNENKYIYIDLN